MQRTQALPDFAFGTDCAHTPGGGSDRHDIPGRMPPKNAGVGFVTTAASPARATARTSSICSSPGSARTVGKRALAASDMAKTENAQVVRDNFSASGHATGPASVPRSAKTITFMCIEAGVRFDRRSCAATEIGPLTKYHQYMDKIGGKKA